MSEKAAEATATETTTATATAEGTPFNPTAPAYQMGSQPYPTQQMLHPEPPPPYSATQGDPAYGTTGVASGAPPPGAPGAPSSASSAVLINVGQLRFGPDRLRMTCPNCNEHIQTTVKSSPGLGAWLLGSLLCIFGCFCGCCLIPCCVDSMKVVSHSCPKCKNRLGTYKGPASLA